MDVARRKEFMTVAYRLDSRELRRRGLSLREFLHEIVTDADTPKDVAVKIFLPG